MGVDSVVGGYNPHKLSDQSTITAALANMVLPSVFRPGPDGTPALDRTLMVSAQVTSAQPYLVTYRLKPEAAWSDSAPIAAEDFVYLWEQARDEPGVVDSAGYRLISNISARDSGRVVEVTFAKPYPGWRELFGNLLPSHLLKDIPGGWSNALKDNFPAAGGPFSIKNIDRDRGEVVLERNDRYWSTPVPLDRVILRRGDAASIASAVHTGHDQLAVTAPDSKGMAEFSGLGSPVVTTAAVPKPAVATVLLRPVSTPMADQRVRSAIVALTDRTALMQVGTGGGPGSTLVANGLVLPPSARGYAPTATAPAKPDIALAEGLLTQAGYTKVNGSWALGETPLNLVIAAPADHPGYLAMARELQRQLSAGGVQSRLITPAADELYTTLLAPRSATAVAGAAQVDLVVAPQPAGGDPATVLATRYGCAAAQGDTGAQSANPTGFCDPTVQQTIDRAITGEMSLGDALAAVEPALWSKAIALPVYQEADALVAGRELTGVAAGPPGAGPFATAPQWQRPSG
ncbi:ABC transporter family substrate-binding protein [Actinokineospora inagensis]|uniref:ABC transporter family substrate-binding protein n=1 Tax=Actinokineospora inagensis TaxID=103730 RepID=UPI0003F82C1D|nr:ABC transporter family substrate-binding protein [Actinokineospora inagensis]